MRSNELALAAGVTVRTLRHYHKIGLLAEPGRDANNYRRYDVHHLVRLLRIRRLAALGLGLDSISELLNGTEEDVQNALVALDRELEGQIERLTRQRKLISEIGTGQGAPDLPIELAPFYELFGAGIPEEGQRMNLEQSVLLAHIVGDDGMPQLVDYLQQLASHEHRDRAIALGQLFYKLGPDSKDEEIEALVLEYATILKPIISEWVANEPPKITRRGSRLLDEHTLTMTNVQQRQVIDALVKRLKP